MRNNEKITEEDIEKVKSEMKDNATIYDINSFDIFGNIKNDKTKISVLSNKKHRESEKDKYKILDLSDNVTIEDYKELLNKKIGIIEKAIEKAKALTDIDIYLCPTDKFNLSDMRMFYINPTDEHSI